jgi:alpha-tubulin suppressor-like RCC1 family protein
MTALKRLLVICGICTACLPAALAATPMVSLHASHSLALKSDGTVVAWGRNGSARLGNGSYATTTSPVDVSGLTDVVAVAAGAEHSVALKADGTVWTWGSSQYGQLGTGQSNVSKSTPVQVSGLSGVVAIAAGDSHTLAVKSDGTVWAWGRNQYFQLGNGSADSAVPLQVANISNAVAVAAGQSHSMAVLRDGSVWAWGRNNRGQLGRGTYSSSGTLSDNSPAAVSQLTDVTAIDANFEFSMALKKDGTVWVWGDNYYGQLGRGQPNAVSGANITDKATTPEWISSLSGITAISAGMFVAGAVKADGTLYAWGRNSAGGQLGTGDKIDTGLPIVTVQGISEVAGVSFGGTASVAWKNDGSVWAWGENGSYSYLGNGSTSDAYLPVAVNAVGGQGSLKLGVSIADSSADCLFAWAEKSYPSLLAPANSASQVISPYRFRHYPQTNSYLGTSSADGHVYYVANGGMMDLGSFSQWRGTAGCQ